MSDSRYQIRHAGAVRALALFLPLLVMAGCASERAPGHTAAGTYKVGTPYQVSGQWYYPHEDFTYDETGIASWYGADFHGGKTSNGEIFNKDELTAAHKTLPLPTLARVTNLENGKSIVVRINDRGPFSGDRLIDMSQRAAQLLGFEQKGTAQVRVQVLADESKAIADATRHYGGAAQPPVTNVAANEQMPAPVVVEAPTSPEAPMAPEPAIATNNVSPVAVTSQPLSSPDPEVKTLEPIRTTPAVHQQLLRTQPVQEVVQMPVGPHHIYVQAGAFTVLENATKLQQRLSSFGSVSVVDAIVNGKKFYRVRVGPLNDVPHADALLKKVQQEQGARNARTVVD